MTKSARFLLIFRKRYRIMSVDNISMIQYPMLASFLKNEDSIMIGRRGCIMYPAVITILRLVGGLMQTIPCSWE